MSPNIPIGTGVGQRSPFTGNIISKVITIPDRDGSIRRPTTGGGGSSQSTTTTKKSYVDTKGVVRVEGQTGFSEREWARAVSEGTKSSTSNLPSLKGQSELSFTRDRGVINGKVYGRVSQAEIRAGRLAPNTQAVLLPNVSAQRRSVAIADRNIAQGSTRMEDLFVLASGGTRRIDDVLSKRSIERVNQLISAQNAKVIREQEIANKPVLTMGKLLEMAGKIVKGETSLNVLKDRTGKVVGITDNKTKQSYILPGKSLKELQREIKLTELERDFVPPKEKKGLIQRYLELDETLGEFIRGSNDFFKETVISAGRGVLKVFTPSNDANPLSVLRKLGVKIPNTTKVKQIDSFYENYNKKITSGSKLLDKDVQTAGFLTAMIFFPPLVKAYASYNLGFSTAGVVDSLIKKDYKTASKRALSAGLSALILLAGGKKPTKGLPQTGAKAGTIYKHKGIFKMVTKGGRVVNVPVKYNKVLLKMEKLGKPLRVTKTETARAMQKTIRGKPLTRFEKELLKISTERKTLANLVKDGKRLATKVGLKGNDKKEFARLYVKYQSAPTKANIKAFNDFAKKKALERVKVTADKRTIAGAKFRKQRSDLVKGTVSPQKWLKQNKIPVKQSTTLKEHINTYIKETKTKPFKILTFSKKAKTGAFYDPVTKSYVYSVKSGNVVNSYFFKKQLPLGWTDGKNVWVMSKGLLKKSGANLSYEKLLRHEAIHILKKDEFVISVLKKSLKNRIPLKAQKKITDVVGKVMEKRTLRLESKPSVLKGLVKKVKPVSVSKLDLKISNALFKAKYGISKTKVNKIISSFTKRARGLGATPKQIAEVKKLAFNKAVGKNVAKKLNKLLDSIAKKGLKSKIAKAVTQADKKARVKGFRNAKQMTQYEVLVRKSGAGIKGAERKLRAIERDMIRISKKLAKQKKASYDRMVKSLVEQTKFKLKSGQLAIKDKKYRLIKKAIGKQKLTKEQTERLLLQINEKLRRLDRQKVSKERAINRLNAKKALKEISEGKVVQMTPKVRGELKQMMNNEMYASLKAKKLIQLGKTPKLSPLTKAQRLAIKRQAPAQIRADRIARKRLKRSFPSTKASRKFMRKEYLRQIRAEKRIIEKMLRGEPVNNYGLRLNSDGSISLIPKVQKVKSFTYAKNLITKKNIPKNAIEKINKDGTITVLKTEKVTKQVPKTIRQNMVKSKQKVVTETKKQLLKQKAKLESKLKKLKGTKAKISIGEATKRFGKLTAVVLGSFATIVKNVNSLDRVTDTKLAQDSKTIIALLNEQEEKLKQLFVPAIKNKLTSSQVSKLASASKQVRKIKLRLKQISKTKNIKKPLKPKKPIKEKPPIPEIKKLTWDKAPPKGQNYLVNVIVRIKGRNRVIPVRTTPNRALKYIVPKVDNTLARSFDLKIVGLTSKKDVKAPSLRKFRKKRSRGSSVLRVVEKSKYSLDKPGEKRGLTIAKVIKRRTRKLKIEKTKSSGLRKGRSKKRTTRKKRK
jgi:hypothetical protein